MSHLLKEAQPCGEPELRDDAAKPGYLERSASAVHMLTRDAAVIVGVTDCVTSFVPFTSLGYI